MFRIEITDTQLKEILLLPVTISGTGSHFISTCPFCLKPGHFYVQRKTTRTNIRGENTSYFFDCKKCNKSGKGYTLLKQLNRLDLIRFPESTDIFKKLDKINFQQKLEINEFITEDQPLPLSFKRIYRHKYLESRDFTDEQFEKYCVGETNLFRTLDKFLIFAIEEGGINKGYIARNTLSKDAIDKFNKTHKKQILRYNNSVTDFAKLVYGIDEITENTDTAILVEGIFKKFNIDRLLNLYQNESIFCGATFGKKLSEYQIYKLQKRGIKNIIILYDPDAVKEMKQYSIQAERYFNVLVGYCKTPPDDINEEELGEVLDNLQKPSIFIKNFVNKKKLYI